jgi:hypothetical protein
MPHPARAANPAASRILGADVAKAHIVFYDSLTGRCWRTANSPEALRQALQACADYDWLVCETTGGYERLLLESAYAIGLSACRADAARVKAFIASHGGRAKTDPVDAAWLSRYGLERLAMAWSASPGCNPGARPSRSTKPSPSCCATARTSWSSAPRPRTAAAPPAVRACTTCSTRRSPSSPPRSPISTPR